MERKPDCKNRTTKAGRFPGKITKKLGQSKEVYKNNTRKHEEIIWQEEKKLSRAKSWRKYAVGSKYPFKQTFKEVRPKKI